MKNQDNKNRCYSDYKTLRKNRLIKWQLGQGFCEDCGEKAFVAHHIDKTKYNHDIQNLKLLCRKCHKKYHKVNWDGRPSKYKMLYGLSPKEISEKYFISFTRVYRSHKLGTLLRFLNNPTNKSLLYPSKFRSIYGYTLQEIGRILNLSRQRIHQLHCANRLLKRLEKSGK